MMEHYALPSFTEEKDMWTYRAHQRRRGVQRSFASNNDAQDDNALVEASQRKKKSNTE
jgi:hypothetical protein